MRKEKYSMILIVMFALLLNSNIVFADYGTADTVTASTCTPAQVEKFEVTLTKVEISYSSTGSEFITLWEGTKIIDIADAGAAGQAAGEFFSGATLAEGTIRQIRYTCNAAGTFRGYCTLSGTTYRTNNTLPYADAGTTGATDIALTDPIETSYITTVSTNIAATSSKTTILNVTFNFTNAFSLLQVNDAPVFYQIVPRQVVPQITEG